MQSLFSVLVWLFSVGLLDAEEPKASPQVKFLKEDGSSQQLFNWTKTHQKIHITTGENGIPVPSLTASLGIGRRGPLLFEDLNLQNHLASLANERIPERVVHAKGAGAFGHFVVTNPDIIKYTRAKLFQPNTTTQVSVRFSTNLQELGSADSGNDLRGFAVKFYTADGNYDLLMLNTPNFNIRDPMLFPSLIRSRKRNPATHFPDNNMYWDFNSNRPETTFHTLLLFSDLGFPSNYRHMSGFAVNTFKWTGGSDTGSGEFVFVRYNIISNQGKKISSPQRYVKDAGRDPDSFIRDLYNSISVEKYPSWTLNVQIVTQKQANGLRFNPFDATKIFPTKDFPLIPIGKMTLNRNPKDYFNEVEQIAFNPGNFVPGIEASPDRLVHGRVFTYGVAQRYRLGKNFNQLPINRPRNGVNVNTYTRDGFMNIDGNGDGGPNYFPNTYNGAEPVKYARPTVFMEEGGLVNRTDTGNDDNFSQARNYYNQEMSSDEQKRTIKAIAQHLAKASPKIRERALEKNWRPVSEELYRALTKEIKAIARNRRRQKKIQKEAGIM